MALFNYQAVKFYTTVNDLEHLPNDSQAEVAIVGRSNCGKSSLLNTLVNHTRLAFTSKTPGRTQHINYFQLAPCKFLVDLPGYGYAKVTASIKRHWQELLSTYLQTREALIGLIMIMDSRHPLKDLDYQMLQFFLTKRNLPVHIVLSKIDKLTKIEQQDRLQRVKTKLVQSGFNCSLQVSSAKDKVGVIPLQEVLDNWFSTYSKSINLLQK